MRQYASIVKRLKKGYDFLRIDIVLKEIPDVRDQVKADFYVILIMLPSKLLKNISLTNLSCPLKDKWFVTGVVFPVNQILCDFTLHLCCLRLFAHKTNQKLGKNQK